MKVSLLRFLLGLVIVLRFSACAASQASPPRPLTVIGTEMAFAAPDQVAAGHYAVTYRNDGSVYHELAFRDPNGQIAMRRSIAAGQQVVLDVTLTPGTWELGCFEPGHYAAGMHRILTVSSS